jgi:hypothetical protein
MSAPVVGVNRFSSLSYTGQKKMAKMADHASGAAKGSTIKKTRYPSTTRAPYERTVVNLSLVDVFRLAWVIGVI